MTQVREVPLPTHHIEEEINRSLAMQSGFTVEQVSMNELDEVLTQNPGRIPPRTIQTSG